ncbi:MAG: hypothetical protein M3552_00985 [Planctomycetota bacterium]|nr:hypothetical protein [Planctomycetaceae bacterium]MDQ3329220.1 hypothetical protein [Planctomycetota bacterium]
MPLNQWFDALCRDTLEEIGDGRCVVPPCARFGKLPVPADGAVRLRKLICLPGPS